ELHRTQPARAHRQRRCTAAATSTPIKVARNRITNRALVSGRTPNRIREYILIGSVSVPGAFVKNVMRKSSNESANTSNHATTKLGVSIGTVTRQNACHRVAPQSWAASSSVRSKSATAADNTMK